MNLIRAFFPHLFILLLFKSLSTDIYLEKDLTIGNGVINSNIYFSAWVQHLYVDGKGNIFVSDRDQARVFQFSEAGELINEIGRRGRGPSEFTGLSQNIWVSGDSLFAYDTDQFRITSFDLSENAVINTTVLDLRFEEIIVFYQPNRLFYDFQRRNIVFKLTSPYTMGTGNIERFKKFIVLDENLEIIDNNLLTLPADESYINDRGSSITVSGLLPFVRKSMVAQGVGDYGNHLCHGWTEDISLECIDMYTGEVLTSFNVEHNNTHVSNEDLNRKLSIFPESGNLNQSEIRQAIQHDTWPAFDWFVLDDTGNFWIAVNGENRELYNLHKVSYDGEFLGVAPFPKSDQIHMIRNGFAYAISENEMGERLINRYKIRIN